MVEEIEREASAMSEFSSRLEEYIRLSGYTIYSFAKKSGINRTSLNKITTEHRLPTLDSVKNICSYLKVSDVRKDELIELYKKEKYGAGTVEAWKRLKDFFDEFYFEDNSGDIRQGDPYVTHIPEKILIEPETETDAREIVIDMIIEELNEKNPEIFMDLSWASASVLRFICQRGLYRNLTAHLFLTMNQMNVRDATAHNFENIKQVLESVFYMREHLDARYAYVNDAKDGNKYQPFGHYFITHRRVVLFSDDDWRIKIISEKNIAEAFMKREIERLKTFRPLIVEGHRKDETRLKTVQRLYIGRSLGVIKDAGDKLVFFLKPVGDEFRSVSVDVPELIREFDEYVDLMEENKNLYEGVEAQSMLEKM